MYGMLFWYLVPPFVILGVIAVIGLWGARRARRDIMRVAGVREEDE